MTDVGRLARLLDRAPATHGPCRARPRLADGGAGAGHRSAASAPRTGTADDALLIEAESLAEIAMRVD